MNPEQGALILEFVHCLCTPDSEPIQALAGPAGSGKNLMINLIMETEQTWSTTFHTA